MKSKINFCEYCKKREYCKYKETDPCNEETFAGFAIIDYSKLCGKYSSCYDCPFYKHRICYGRGP